MNGNSILLDTNIILYLFGGDRSLISVLEGKNLYISFVTQLELLSYQGITQKETRQISEFIDECTIIDITEGIKEIAIKLRKKHKLRLPDSLILATAIWLNIPVITADKDFTKVPDADVIIYES